jgi:hypothetical protein
VSVPPSPISRPSAKLCALEITAEKCKNKSCYNWRHNVWKIIFFVLTADNSKNNGIHVMNSARVNPKIAALKFKLDLLPG